MFHALRKILSPAAGPAGAQAVDWKQRGNDHLAKGMLDEAVACYRRAVEAAPAEVAARVNLGYGLLRQGEFGEARRCFEQAVAADPSQHEAHFLLGQAAQAQGDAPGAEKSYADALNLRPDFEPALLALSQLDVEGGRLWQAQAGLLRAVGEHPGLVDARRQLGRFCLDQGDFAGATEWFSQAAALRPADGDLHAHLGLGWESQGRMDEAERSYRQALALEPANAQARFGLSNVFVHRGEHAQAAQGYEQVLALIPGHATAMMNLGEALWAMERREQAVEWFGRGAQHAPSDPAARIRLGDAHASQGRTEEADACYRQALDLRPDDPIALGGHANCLLAAGRAAEALAIYGRVLTLRPEHESAPTHLAKGNALRDLGRDDEALVSFRQALRVRPGYADALVNLGGLLQARNRYAEAIEAYREVLALDSGNAAAHWNLALCLLVVGDLEAGWREFEWRWDAPFTTGRWQRRHFAQPQWTGAQPLQGKTILLHAEQGLGDGIQFCRYAGLLAERGATVLLDTPLPLRDVLDKVPGVARLVLDGETLPPFDYHCPLLSLPLALGTTLDTIPSGSVPYVRSQPELVERWRQKLGSDGRRLVGVVWSGNAQHVNDSNRSMALAQIAALAGDGIRLVSLQKEMRAADQEALAASPVEHFGELLTDFAQTAALADCMDVVVSVDTSVAHLAGAMGKPLWLLLPYSPDWRWLLERTDSPWYPSARLFRQGDDRRWAPVLAEVRQQLATVPDNKESK